MARKQSSRCLLTNVKMDGRPTPDDANSSLPDVLQENFSILTIGTRKKEKMKSDTSKEDEIYSEEDSDFQDVNFLDKWSSVDRITVDGSESSEWGRSISSSMSWFDESEYEATLKVKNLLDNIDNVLYGEVHTPLPKPLVEECQQWRQRFPHLRVVGFGLVKPPIQETENDLSDSENGSTVIEGEHLGSSREKMEDPNEGEEEVYASHGKVELQQVLSHEFCHHHEPLKDPKCEKIKDALLSELASHVWKEVVVPSLKPFIEKQPSNAASRVSKGEGEPNGTCVARNQCTVKGTGLRGGSGQPLQSGTSLSAREGGTVMQADYQLSDPFECYRRYSDQLSYCDVKCSSDFMSLEMVAETSYDAQEMKELKNRKFSRNSGKDHSLRQSSDMKLKQKALRRTTPQEDRSQLSSRGSRQIGVVEDLKPLKKATAWMSSKGEGLEYSGKYIPQKETRHLTLPAIKREVITPDDEGRSFMLGRSSSAFPKLPHRNFRPTLSSCQNKAEPQASGRKDPSLKYNKADPLESEVEFNQKITRNAGYHSGLSNSRSRNNKQGKGRQSNNSQNLDLDNS